MTLTVNILSEESDLEQLADEWRAITKRLPACLPTQCYEYVRAYRHAFSLSRLDFQLFAVRRAGQLVAVLPARCETRRVFGVQLRVLAFADLPMPVRDIVVVPDLELVPLVDALSHALRDSWPWHYAHFRAVPASSRLVRDDRKSGVMVLRSVCGASNAIDVSSGHYLKNVLTSNMRSNLKRKRKRLDQRGAVEFVTVTAPPALEQAYQAFLDTESAGWKSVSGGKRAVKLHANQTSFYRTLMLLKAAQRQAHIHLLLLDGTPIASDFCIVSGDVCYSLKHGYDESYEDATPGNLLRAYTIEYYESQPSIRTLDLISAWSWHERWRPQARPIYDVKVYSRTALGRALYHAHRVKGRQRLPAMCS